MVPYSHKLRRHPNAAEISMQTELTVPIICGRGDIACWDGSVWHSFGLRRVPGERVVIHTTYSRSGMLPLFRYGRCVRARA